MKKFFLLVLFLVPFSAQAGLENVAAEIGTDVLTGILAGTKIECQLDKAGHCKGVAVHTGKVAQNGDLDIRVKSRRKTRRIFDIEAAGEIPSKTFCIPACK
ncbi:hypothetical protein KC851_03090 [Candidatus Kaiserbacteria bacterium]|nr:hypothetical protein [Candidatus Kaiserbacteria bacterium]